MPIRMSGINSGLDTEALVSELVSAYSKKTEKYEKAQTKVAWKQEAWKSINSKVYSLYSSVGNLRYSSAYSLKKTTVSDPTKATITASSDAINGTQSLEIKRLATTGYLTGGQLAKTTTSKTTLGELGYASGDGKIKVSVGGETKEIEISENTTVSSFVSKLKDAGLAANFDEANHRLFVSSKDSGKDNEFTITGADASGLKALSSLKLLTSKDTAVSEEYAQTAAYATKDGYAAKDGKTSKEVILETLMSLKAAHNLVDKVDAYEKNHTSEEIAGISARAVAMQAKIDAGDVTEDSIAAIKAKIDAGEATDEEKELYNNYQEYKEYKEYESLKASYDDKKAFIADNSRFDKGDYSAYDDAKLEALADSIDKQIKTAVDVTTNGIASLASSDAIRVNAQDAKIILNGAVFESSSNTINVNGLTISATGLTAENSPITITTATDTQGLYDKIKDFLTEYNSVINEITKYYNAEAAKDYEPLTDEEKDAMSDTEIEKWESKIKSSLLRRDNQLGSIMNAMTNAMAKSYEINGKKYALSSFGISTLGYFAAEKNENNAFHIDGDEEDAKTSGNPDKLRVAIASDPDAVIDFMKKLTSDLYSSVDERMKGTSLRSRYSVYNDKEMASEYSSYNSIIKSWKDKVTDMEDRYYKQFSKMETALAKLQQNSSSVTAMLGQ